MSPFDAAVEVYRREPCARTFEHDLFLHLMHGTVIATPDVFAMVRPVRSDWGLDDLRDPSLVDPAGDCWWIWLAAGDVGRLFGWLEPKLFVAFERKNTPKRVRYERIHRLWRPILGA